MYEQVTEEGANLSLCHKSLFQWRSCYASESRSVVINRSYSYATLFSVPKSDEQTDVHLLALASGIHFVSPQSVLCCYW